jgi:hypothetical protein
MTPRSTGPALDLGGEVGTLTFDRVFPRGAEIDKGGYLFVGVQAQGGLDVTVIGGVLRDPDASPAAGLCSDQNVLAERAGA